MHIHKTIPRVPTNPPSSKSSSPAIISSETHRSNHASLDPTPPLFAFRSAALAQAMRAPHKANVSVSISILTGLETCPSIPASMQRCRSVSIAFAVSAVMDPKMSYMSGISREWKDLPMMMGCFGSPLSVRIIDVACRPLITG